jgi:hypothetical protein
VSVVSFTIRERQLEALGRSVEMGFVMRMRQFALVHFPAQTASLSPDDLDRLISHSIEAGRLLELRSARDLCRFFGLTLALGSEQPAWIEAAWRDPWISSPGARLDRIIGKILRQAELAEVNARMRAAFDCPAR